MNSTKNQEDMHWKRRGYASVLRCERNAALGLRPRSHISHQFSRLNGSDVEHLYNYRMACLAFLSVHDGLTPPLSSALNLTDSTRPCRQLKLRLPPLPRHYSKKAPLYLFAEVWNDLPLDCRKADTLRSFKKIVKTTRADLS